MASVQKLQLAEDFSVYANPAAKLEVEFIYKEIFIDGCYDMTSSMPDDAFIVDAGGNIGLFSLFMKKKLPRCTILAFEPAPATFATFQRNMALHGVVSGVQAHQCGLGREETASMALTFYPQMPGNSTLYSEDKKNQMRSIDPDHPIAKLMQEKEEVQVHVRRLSGFLDDVPGLKRVDLLKIDVEGAELDVLRGVDDKHWGLIDNVVVELCDSKGDLAVTKALLESKGLTVTTERPDWAPEHLKMYMLIAKRR